MAGSAKATIDHDEIRRWVEERGGCPSRVKRTGAGDDPGILRIDFPGYSGKRTLEMIPWDEFFQWFDDNNLAFLHQDTTANGKTSRFSKLVSRDSVDVETQPRRTEAKKGERARPPKVEAQAGEQPKAAMQPVGDPLDLIVTQHEEVRGMFVALIGGDVKVAADLLSAIALHSAIEEAIVYPMMLDGEVGDKIRESIFEHAGVKRLIGDLIEAPVADEAWWAGMRVLRRELEQHMAREEDEILPVLDRELVGDARQALAAEMVAFIGEFDEPDTAIETALSNVDAIIEQEPVSDGGR